jgi:hypothetical protein
MASFIKGELLSGRRLDHKRGIGPEMAIVLSGSIDANI